MSAQFLPNPFTQRGAIRDPAQFFGRQAELNQIFSCIGKMQSVSVVGERRIGKSSLLHYICHTGRPHLPLGTRLIYLDVQRVKSEGDFYARMLNALGSQGSTFRDLENAVAEKQVVACLDEFEQVVGNEAFSVGFFDGLRSLAQDGLALVTATQHSLFELCRDKKFAGSQFWNIFQRTALELFTEVEARQFIQERFADVGMTVSDNEILHLLHLAGRFPFFLQLAYSCLFEAQTRQIPQWEQAFGREVHDYLVALWEHLTPPAPKALRWALELEGQMPDEQVRLDLQQRGLLVQDSEKPFGLWVFSKAFEDIVRNPPKRKRKWQWPTLKTVREWIKTLQEAKDLVVGGEEKEK